MKRYDVGEYSPISQRSYYESKTGDWVKWEDIEFMVVQAGTSLIHLNKRITELESEVDDLKFAYKAVRDELCDVRDEI